MSGLPCAGTSAEDGVTGNAFRETENGAGEMESKLQESQNAAGATAVEIAGTVVANTGVQTEMRREMG